VSARHARGTSCILHFPREVSARSVRDIKPRTVRAPCEIGACSVRNIQARNMRAMS
jgi:hypothetical protein